MQELDVMVNGVPEEICLMVKYVPRPENPQLCFTVSGENGTRFKPYYDSLRKHFPKIVAYVPDDKSRLLFGSSIKEDNDFIANLFDLQDYPGREPDAYSPHAIADEPPRKFHDDYPWHLMKNVGDHFLVVGGKQAVISVLCSKQTDETEKRYRTTKLKSGILVILVDTPNAKIQHIVNKVK